MDPITIEAGALVLGSLVQLYNSQQARGDSKAALNQTKEMFDAIKPPDYNLAITAPPALHQELLQSPKFSSPEAAPKFNLDKLTPEQLTSIGQFAPEAAKQVFEQNPQLIKKTADMQTGRNAQLAALQKFQQVGSGEFDPAYQQKVMEAEQSAQNQAQSRQQSILQDFARRGQGGSGASLAAQLSGAGQSMNSLASANLGAASQSYQNQLNALSQGAQLGGQIQSQDQSLQSQNADIINAFNQRMAANQGTYNQGVAQAANQGQLYNLQNAQSLANQNVQARNAAAQDWQKNNNAYAQTSYQDMMQANQMQNQSAQQGYLNNVNAQNQQNQNAITLANWNQQQKAYGNDLSARQYQDQLQKAQGQAGMTSEINKQNIGATQDVNQAIQGGTNIFANYETYQQKQLDDEKAAKKLKPAGNTALVDSSNNAY